MARKIKLAMASIALLGLVACGGVDVDSGVSPSLSGSTSGDSASEGNKQPTILPGPDHQDGVPTDEETDDGVSGGNDVAPPESPDSLGVTPNNKNPN